MSLSLRARAVQTALGVEIFNVSYNIVEGILALGLGIAAASISLETFGLDSLIEVTAGVILIWRLQVERHGGDAEKIERVEHRAERFVGFTLLALAGYVVVQSGYALWTRQAPETSGWGIVLAILSVVIMPLLARWKLRLAEQIPSRALRADAFETIACAYLSCTLLLGLGTNYLFGWWWADPLAALVMVFFIVREAREALSGRAEDDD